ncbi:MAG: insulinase family protein [Acidobacteria bacterium]|nr:insulinase family protein [Acidobacteriota bacterium]
MFHLQKFLARLVLILVVVFSGAASASAQSAPQPEAPSSDPIPVTQRELLLNDLPIVVASRPGKSQVTITALVKIGATFDRAGKAGLAALTAQSLLAGSKNRDGSPVTVIQLKDELESVGGQISIATSWDDTRLTITGPARNVTTLIEILGRLVTLPSFSEDEFNKIKQAQIAARETSSPQDQADARFAQDLYGGHPYHHVLDGTPESLRSISRFDVIDFHKRHYLSNNAALVIVGDVTMAQILRSARQSFGVWIKGKPAPYTFLPPNEFQGTKIVFHPNPTQSQVQIRAGAFTGSTFNGLLHWKLVDKLLKTQWSPDAALAETRHLPDSPWMVRLTASPDQVVSTIETLQKTLKNLREPPLPADTLNTAKEAVLKDYQMNFQSNASIANLLIDMERYQIGRRSLAEWPQQLQALPVADLQPYLDCLGGKQLLVVVQGGKPELAEKLRALGTVEVVSPSSTSTAKPSAPQPEAK